MELARKKDINVGMLKLNTVWPFPEERIRDLSESVKTFIMPEINFGQVYYDLERCAGSNSHTVLIPPGGGAIHDPRDILDVIRREAR